ncbi:MAG: addiction module protein [Myxococcales bacterium]|nr:addiction module protein [Myxococcales bacterium]
MTKQEVLQAALALPEEERAQLVEELEASLPMDDDDEFIAMINARVAAAKAGEPGIPADEVFDELLRE